MGDRELQHAAFTHDRLDRLADRLPPARVVEPAERSESRDHLLVSLHHKRTERIDCHAALLCAHADGAPAAVLDLDAGGVEPAPSPSTPGPADGEAGEEPGERDRWIAARAALIARAARPATVAATTLAKERPVPADPGTAAGVEKDEPVDDRPAWRRGRAGTSVGRAVHAVLQTVDLATGLLGHATSSRRYKEDIRPMENASQALYRLHPVTFRYNKDIDRTQSRAFGLIAEEVAEVDPDLIARNSQGQPESVHYEAVNAMLLNEFLKEHRKVEELQATVAQQRKDSEATAAQQQKEIEALTATLKAQASESRR